MDCHCCYRRFCVLSGFCFWGFLEDMFLDGGNMHEVGTLAVKLLSFFGVFFVALSRVVGVTFYLMFKVKYHPLSFFILLGCFDAFLVMLFDHKEVLKFVCLGTVYRFFGMFSLVWVNAFCTFTELCFGTFLYSGHFFCDKSLGSQYETLTLLSGDSQSLKLMVDYVGTQSSHKKPFKTPSLSPSRKLILSCFLSSFILQFYFSLSLPLFYIF